MRLRLLSVAFCLAWQPIASAQVPVVKPLARVTAADLEGGAKVYTTYCARCHGLDGTGGMGPPLAHPRLRRAADQAAIIDIVMNGIPGTAMMGAWSLSEREIRQVSSYVLSLGRRPAEVLPGDPTRGQAIYTRAACATCHIVGGNGSGVGAGSH
jgi:cytochrome c oxidase cbb3-type subunit 3